MTLREILLSLEQKLDALAAGVAAALKAIGGRGYTAGQICFFGSLSPTPAGFLRLSQTSITYVDTTRYTSVAGHFQNTVAGGQKINLTTSTPTTQSSTYGGIWSASKLFDGSNADGSNVMGFDINQVGERWFTIDFGSSVLFDHFVFTQRTYGAGNMPWVKIKGSDSLSGTWTDLVGQTTLDTAASAKTTVPVMNMTPFRFVRVSSQSLDFCCLGEFEAYLQIIGSATAMPIPPIVAPSGCAPFIYVGA